MLKANFHFADVGKLIQGFNWMKDLDLFNKFDKIRHLEVEGEKWYAVVDVIEVLIETSSPSRYWNELRASVKERSKIELFDFTEKFSLRSKSKKNSRSYKTDCANREGLLRIVQSIPSPKVEGIKQWLAQTGDERMQEAANPLLLLDKAEKFLEAHGYSPEFIRYFLKHRDIRNKLTKRLSVDLDSEGIYTVLDTVTRSTFGYSIEAYKDLKGLGENEVLELHMTDKELVIGMLDEMSTNQIIDSSGSSSLESHQDAAERGGKIAQKARLSLEEQTGAPVSSKTNYLKEPEKEVRKKLK